MLLFSGEKVNDPLYILHSLGKNATKDILSDISATIYAILDPSGSGKTALLSLLDGLDSVFHQ